MPSQFEDAAMQDLQSREFQPETKPEFLQEELKPTSLGKARGYSENDNDEPVMLPGYIEIWQEQFPSRGLFYPNGTRFFIRSAQVKEIRQWSTINEQDPFSVDEGLNEILRSCLMIRMPGKQMSFKDLREEDRIFVILSIRELTFPNGENQLVVRAVCNECQHENEFKIEREAFEFNELEDTIMKYYDDSTKMFFVETKSVGSFKIIPPSIGVMSEITKYIQKRQQDQKKIDQSFVKVLPYLIQEWRGFNESVINNLEIEFLSWNTTKFQVMNKITEMCRVGVKEIIKKECEKCSGEVSTKITFPGGIKSLFIVSDIATELL